MSLPGTPEKGGRNHDIPFILDRMAMTFEILLTKNNPVKLKATSQGLRKDENFMG